MGAQELVGPRELGAEPGGVAAGGLGGLLGAAAQPARLLRGAVGRGEGLAPDGDLGARGLDAGRRGRGLLLQELELPGQRGLALGVQALELGFQRLDALAALLVGAVRGVLGPQQLELAGAVLHALGQRGGGLLRALQAQLDAVGRGARAAHLAHERFAALGALGERGLGRPAALGDPGQAERGLVAGGAGRLGRRLGFAQRRPARAHGVAAELPARLGRLALQALVELGGLRLALERLEPGAGLALHVEGAVEVLLGALQLELGPAPALAVLAQAGGLLDEQPAVARLGGDDVLHPALRDDGVHLLAEARVGEDLQHVDEPAARAVEAVLALPRAVQAAGDGDLAQGQVQGAVGVVQDDLHLGLRAGLDAAAAAEDHVLHRLAADRERGLLPHGPQHGVGDVGLARPVGADDDRDARGELEQGAVREGLEALQRDGAQVHG